MTTYNEKTIINTNITKSGSPLSTDSTSSGSKNTVGI